MGPLGKIGVALVIVIAVGLGVIWWEAEPARNATNYLPGSLGRAVADACDPTQPLGGRPISEGLTCRDLAAQESMAVSTARLFWISWAQIAIGVAGTVAVVWTVLVALRSSQVTQKALEHQQIAARMQLRPTFVANPVVAVAHGTGRLRVSFLHRNCGVSTARRFRHGWTRAVVLAGGGSQLDPAKAMLRDTTSEVPKDGVCGFHFRLKATEAASLAAGTHVLQIAYLAIFDDDLGGRYKFTNKREYSGDLSSSHTLKGFEFVEPELEGRER